MKIHRTFSRQNPDTPSDSIKLLGANSQQPSVYNSSSLGLFSPLLFVVDLHAFDEGAQRSHLVVLVLLKVEVVLFAEAQLQQVVVKRLLGHVHFRRSVFERIPHKIAISENSVVQTAPKTHLLNDFLNRSLLSTFTLVLPVLL